MTLLRHPVKPEDYKRGYDDQSINDACNTLYGIGDRTLVEDAMVTRFAYVLEREKDGDTGSETTKLTGFNSVVDSAARAAIRNGQFEIIRRKLFDNIVGAQATLFPGSSYIYDNEAAGKLITDVRDRSSSGLSALRWDTVACGVGSCVLYLEVKGNVLQETEVRPTAIWVIFADAITDGASDRATNTMDIDEASCVVMQLAGVDRYAAWFGPSVEYPVGRHVTYTAKKFSDIPNVEDPEGNEYTTSGEYRTGYVAKDEVANPLSLWGGYSKTDSTPVYPFSILYGSDKSQGLIPTSTSLYKSGLEVDLIESLILGASGRGARGAQVLTGDATADPSDIPDNTSEGLIPLGRGRDLSFTGWSPTHAKAANEVVAEICQAAAHAEHVPSHIAMPETDTAPMSGTAIRQKSKALTDYRALRIDMNRAGVLRRWNLEKALLNATEGKAKIPEETTETWKPKDVEFAIDPADEMTDWDARIKIGEASILDVIMARRGFTSVNDALQWAYDRKALLEKNKEVIDYFKPSAPAATTRTGLFNR